MERNVNYTLVGIFVIATLSVGFLFIVWLLNGQDKHLMTDYTVYFNSDVNGLEEGSAVKYRGVSVGKVNKIRLAQDRPDLIKVDIEIDKTTPVYQNTTGVLKPKGITGLSFIELTTTNSDKKVPIVTSANEKFPVITTEPSKFDQILNDAPQITDRVKNLADNLNTGAARLNMLFGDNNQDKVNSILANLDFLIKNTSMMVSPENTKAIAKAIADIQKFAASANAIVDNKNRLKLQATLANLEKTTANLNTVTSVLAQNSNSLGRFSGETLHEMNLLVEDSRKTMKAVTKLSASLTEKPSKIIYQPNYNGIKIEND